MQKLLIASALVLAISAPAFAQEDYTEFASKEDFFTITFPGKPVVTDGTWLTEYFVNLPSKVYTVSGISGKHTLTVVDYTPVERILVEKSAKCPPGAETCIGVGDTGFGYWKNDVRGAVTYAMNKLIADKDVKVTHLMFNFMEMVGGQVSHRYPAFRRPGSCAVRRPVPSGRGRGLRSPQRCRDD